MGALRAVQLDQAGIGWKVSMAILCLPTAALAAGPPEVISAVQRAALQQGDGRVVIRCTVAGDGAVKNCSVLSETPTGLGFGDSALRVAKLFKMTPKTKDGQPTSGALITIPIRFKQDDLLPGDGATVGKTPVTWAIRPTRADVERVRPVDLSIGVANLQCTIKPPEAPPGEGSLHDCTVLQETPVNRGLGQAALSLTPHFQVDQATLASVPNGAVVRLVILWPTESAAGVPANAAPGLPGP
jgi:TonB family protein